MMNLQKTIEMLFFELHNEKYDKNKKNDSFDIITLSASTRHGSPL
jgi:hypothetical protein